MTVLFFELRPRQRAGGIDTVAEGLARHLPKIGVVVKRNASIFDLGTTKPGIVHFHGIWSLRHALAHVVAKLLGWKVAISPHGSLDPWSLSHLAGKKNLYWWLIERFRVRKADIVVACSNLEMRNIRSKSPDSLVRVARIGVDPPSLRESEALPTSDPQVIQVLHPVFLFLGRIHLEKRVLDLIMGFSQAKLGRMDSDKPYAELVIAGPGKGPYFDECVRAAEDMPPNRIVRFVGPVWDEAKWKLLRQADVLCLPSPSENYGIVAAEALSVGTPVLTTDATPWPTEGPAGFVLTTTGTVDSIAGELTTLVATVEDYRVRRNELASRARSQLSWSAVLPAYREIYRV